ncbi:probable inactive ATP-dependent zinc metalloprotease FTSHI 5, chloroplastic [Ricinus communis]|uniref:probable inactive ATP-dependent zinc metalloprotease FTSHI 5, chloroplastic n=1 Tax=Ricinus communis TaxID=3988 RepID=UPI00077232EA|nr:probable inactive ATP-dependent zinc metalloprotease FTSHI 5, chloroplastic [Ricinus communis]|eukprot:XP_015576554.1 probable inactive ATP-dependent zinc metalloprotease FTSHI 5, chloroplastic [Ricinus communis]
MASLSIPSFSHFSPPFKIPPSQTTHKFKITKIYSHSNRALPFLHKFHVFSFPEASKCHKTKQEPSLHQKKLSFSTGYLTRHEESVIQCITRPIVYALFCIAIGFCSVGSFPAYAAVAEQVASEVIELKKKEKEKKLNEEKYSKGHEYSDYSRNLLAEVSVLLKCIEETRRRNGDSEEVDLALKAVKAKKEGLQGQILEGLYSEVRELKKEKESLEKRADKILDEGLKARREYETLGINAEKGRMEELEERMGVIEEEYSGVWEKVGEIEDAILRRETMAMSVGIRELCFIERECEELVKRFNQEMRRKSKESPRSSSITKLSKSEIQRELETAQRKLLEQKILPTLVEVDGFGPLFDQDLVNFSICIKQGLKDSRKLQKDLEARVRKKMKKFGDEKRLIVMTPANEVVKGFPEVELKWMFGNKEVLVPKAIRLHLYHGWKKWREDAKANLKRNLLEDVDFAKQYVAQIQERILLDRDRVVSKTWYNEEKNRWEMDPIAVPYAVSKKLVEHARIRHDWGAMYLALKADDKEYYVDIKEFDMLYEDFGGFDGLYMKMLAQDIPTAVHLMWIPFSELNLHQQFLLIARLVQQCISGIWKTRIVSYGRDWILEKIRNMNDDIMMAIVFPMVEFIIPYPVRLRLGMAWPEEIEQSVGSTWYLKWQSEAEMSFKSRKTDNIQWFIWFVVRSALYGYILFHVFRFLKRKVPRLLGFGPLRRNPNLRKLQRVKAYINYKVRRIKRKKKAGIDPIKSAFEQMKRVKNPPIPLKDFASIDSMREEINEVVAFLQNPRAFQEIGARAPRGVLIVGERGTGKTSLALAIAAQAKVPVVKVSAQQLEAGLWVGQSASNVRELFQTARDLAPVIIFVEDFDLFAGVRGKFIHTKQQDHEAFINQLLVELDGFEKQDGVVLMATTRNIKQIDEALQRPGRMDRVFYLQLPTQAEREKILLNSAKETMDEYLIDFVDWKKVAEKTALLRPVELKLVPACLEGSAFRSKFVDADELMSYCSWFATFNAIFPKWIRKTKIAKKMSRMLVNHLGLELTKEDLQSVVDLMEPYGQISNGMELLSPPLDWTRETKFPHAVWAAGRGLIALLLPNFDVVDNLWLEPFSWQGIGCTKISKAKSEGSLNGNVESRSYLEKKLVFCFGSYVASQLLLPFGEENFLSSSELRQAQEIATRMVIQYGWGPDDSPAIYYSKNAVTSLSMGNNHEYDMATKVEKMYDLAYLKAREMLQKNQRVLEKIVDELLEFEILTGKDLERILENNAGVQEKEPYFLSKANNREPVSSSFLDTGNGSGPALLGASN